jgi:hypothetical protein
MQQHVSFKRVTQTWWPLAASWMLMGAELPALSAVVARLANPEINLAAYGGVVFPLALIIESPIIMLLAASVALSKDWSSYMKLRRFMMISGALLTGLHIAVAFTPLYYIVVNGIISPPPEIVEPARIGLMIMTPWTWTIAYRRFQQGVLIRFGQSRAVGTGTLIRLSSNGLVLLLGYTIGDLPGIVVATAAVATGVTAEAIFAGWRVRPVLDHNVRTAPPVEPPLSFDHFVRFYVPLAMTSLLGLLVQPIGSIALSRMPMPLESLAVWPVLSGLVFILRSLGLAFNEVVVALLDETGSSANLRRFTVILASGVTLLMLAAAATPMSQFWFSTFSGLPAELVPLARHALWLALLWPGLNAMQSWYQGALVHSRSTRGISEAVAVFLAAVTALMTAGVLWQGAPGLYIGVAALIAGTVAQTVWLWWRSRGIMKRVRQRDDPGGTLHEASGVA